MNMLDFTHWKIYMEKILNTSKNVCCLAFNMTIHSKQVVYQCDTDEVPLSHDIGPNDAPSLGSITIDNTAQVV